MTVTPVVGQHRDTFAVCPVIDYEPPARDIARLSPSSHAPVRSPGARTRPGSHQPPQSVQVPLSPQMRQAAIFADAALRRVLEVIDRRRPAGQLRAVLAPGLVDSVLSVSRAVTGQPGAAVLRRMRVQPTGAEAAAEVFGTFTRGNRVHAIACRVEQLSARWSVVALHIG